MYYQRCRFRHVNLILTFTSWFHNGISVVLFSLRHFIQRILVFFYYKLFLGSMLYVLFLNGASKRNQTQMSEKCISFRSAKLEEVQKIERSVSGNVQSTSYLLCLFWILLFFYHTCCEDCKDNLVFNKTSANHGYRYVKISLLSNE